MARKRTRRTRLHGRGTRTGKIGKTGETGDLLNCAAASAPLKAAVTPSKARFESMAGRDHFTGVASDGRTFKVSLCDNLRIFGAGMALDPLPAMHEYWVGRVCKIRTHHAVRGPVQIWLQVQWYYAGPDAASEASSLFVLSFLFNAEQKYLINALGPARWALRDTSSLGLYERMLSDAYDIVSSLSMAGPANVVEYNEKQLDQPPIQEGTFYLRRNYSSSNKKMNPEPEASCGHCKKAYNPDGAPMIFCPRMHCQKWFHQSCLEEQNSWREIGLTSDDHAIERLRSSPSSDKIFSASPRTIRSQMRGRVKAPSFYEKLEQLEQPLVNCAKQRIARGGSKHGVAGNIKAVLEARSLVQRMLSEDPRAAQAVGSWAEVYENEAVGEDEGGDAEQEPADPFFICLSCKGAT